MDIREKTKKHFRVPDGWDKHDYKIHRYSFDDLVEAAQLGENRFLETGINLPRGKGAIRFGDVLESNMTHDVVVMFHEELKTPIVKILDEDIWFELEKFVNAWGNIIEITDNVNYYSGKDKEL